MTAKAYQPGESYSYPLILKQLLTTPLIYSPDQEIVYRDTYRGTYRTLHERIHRLANGLTRLGVKPGDVVAAGRTLLGMTIVDWTTNNMIEHIYDRLLDRDAKTFKPKPMLATGPFLTTWASIMPEKVGSPAKVC